MVDPRRRWVSLADLAASTLITEWHGIVFRTYCDGSDGDGVLTLASVSADVSLWCSVEREWVRGLTDLGIEEWHTADAIGRTKNTEFQSWTPDDSVRAFNRLASEALFPFRDAHLTAYSCSIVREDYNRFVVDYPDFNKEPEALCVDVCVGGVKYAIVPMAGPNEDRTIPFISVFFDEGERFERMIRRVWQERRRTVGTIFHQITQIGSVNSRYTPAVQIADLVAWIAHRNNSPKPQISSDFHAELMQIFISLCIKHYTRVYDYDRLVSVRAEYEAEREAARRRKNDG
jgi:hypothetical protein